MTNQLRPAAPPYPAPPHAGHRAPQKKNHTWIILVVLLVLGLPMLLVLLGVAGFFFAARTASEPPPVEMQSDIAQPEYVGAQEVLPFERWECTRVINGNTIEVKHAGDKSWVERVKLLYVETPKEGEPGHDEAVKTLEDLVLYKQIATELDPKHAKRDAQGNVLAYVIIMEPAEEGVPGSGGNIIINAEMIKQGHASYDTGNGRSSMYHNELTAGAKGD